jgi:hypothetical protein
MKWRSLISATLSKTTRLETTRLFNSNPARGFWSSSITKSPLPSLEILEKKESLIEGLKTLKKVFACDVVLDAEILQQVRYNRDKHTTWDNFVKDFNKSLTSFISTLKGIELPRSITSAMDVLSFGRKYGDETRFKRDINDIYKFNEVYKKIDKSIRDINYTYLESLINVSNNSAAETKQACLFLNDKLRDYKNAVEQFKSDINDMEIYYNKMNYKIDKETKTLAAKCEVLSNHLEKHRLFFGLCLEEISEGRGDLGLTVNKRLAELEKEMKSLEKTNDDNKLEI